MRLLTSTLWCPEDKKITARFDIWSDFERTVKVWRIWHLDQAVKYFCVFFSIKFIQISKLIADWQSSPISRAGARFSITAGFDADAPQLKLSDLFHLFCPVYITARDSYILLPFKSRAFWFFNYDSGLLSLFSLSLARPLLHLFYILSHTFSIVFSFLSIYFNFCNFTHVIREILSNSHELS
jgi:hypothetical protein